MAIATAEITLFSVVDISKVTRYYKLVESTASAPTVSATTKPPSGWTTTEPSYSNGSTKTLYFVDLTEFTNGEFSYSAVSKSSSYEAAKAAYNKAVDAAKTATNYLNYSDIGLIVGDLIGETLAGNVLIKSAGVEIRNSDIVNARFVGDTIELGRYSEDSLISLCGGKGVIKITPLFGGESLTIESDGALQMRSDGMARMEGMMTNGYTSAGVMALPSTDASGNIIGTCLQLGATCGTSFDDQTRSTLTLTNDTAMLDVTDKCLIYTGSGNVEIYAGSNSDRTKKTLIRTYSKNFYLTEEGLDLSGYLITTGDIKIANNKAFYSYNTSGASRLLMNLNTNNNLVIGYGGYSNNEGLTNIYGNGLTLTTKSTIDLKGEVTFTKPSETRTNLGVWMCDTTTNTSYPGIARPDGTVTGYLRLPKSGLIPYESNADGYGNVGTSSWPFKNGYFSNLYTSGNKMHFSAGDSVNGEWTGAGFVSNSSQSVYFSIPLAKPVIGASAVTVTSENGLMIRQHKLDTSTSPHSLKGGYVYGSSSSAGVIPSTMSGAISWDGNSIRVICTMPNTTNVINNSPCGVSAKLTFTFS